MSSHRDDQFTFRFSLFGLLAFSTFDQLLYSRKSEIHFLYVELIGFDIRKLDELLIIRHRVQVFAKAVVNDTKKIKSRWR